MTRRHFLVREDNGEYDLKPIDLNLAHALDRFGILTGYFLHRVNAERWTFYFMNCQMTPERAHDVARQLSIELLQEALHTEA